MTNSEKVQIGARIKSIRTNAGMTMEKFGELFTPTASKSIISRWEKGKSIPSNDRLKTISKKFGISTTFLLDGKYTLDDLETLKKNEVIPLRDFLESMDNSQVESAINSALDFVNNYKNYDSDSIFAISKLFKLIDTLDVLDQSSLKQPTLDFIGVLLQNLNYMVKNDSENDLKEFYQETIDKTEYPK